MGKISLQASRRHPGGPAAGLLLVFTLLALFLRFAYLEKTEIDTPIRADARQYAIYGYNLAYHGTFSQEFPSDHPHPDSLRSPGYPALVALAFLAGGNEGFYPLVRGAQAVMGALLVPLTFFLGVRFLPVWAALTAAALVAVSPHLVSLPSYLLTEGLFSFVLLASLLGFCAALGKDRPWMFAAAGTLFGLAYLVNESLFFLPLALGAWLFLRSRRETGDRRRSRHAGLALFLACFMAFWGAWWARNTFGLGPDAARGSRRAIMTMVHGSYPDWTYKSGGFRFYPYREDPELSVFSGSWKGFAGIFWERFRARPLRYLSWYLLEKPVWLWTWREVQGPGDIYIYPIVRSLYTVSPAANLTRELLRVLHYPLVLLGLAGVVIALRRRNAGGLPEAGAAGTVLAIALVYFTLLYMVFAPLPRYSYPLRPELFLMALGGAVAAARWRKGRPGAQGPVPSSGGMTR